MSTAVHVFADWEEFETPVLVGTLRSSIIRRKEHFSFNYDPGWLQSPYAQKIDPELVLYTGEQHSEDDRNFRVFLDSCPDRWGRLLMKRREAIVARQEKRRPSTLGEVDYLPRRWVSTIFTGPARFVSNANRMALSWMIMKSWPRHRCHHCGNLNMLPDK